ncbi:DUF4175 family protein [Roseimicrobium sp. ORNL1]|uniref:DUF4175 family protein n=1 Tax=Roseimicrobium sp. ORNL1 TaxID=2711231 RepID=UPI0013E1ED83|nr:DUF4175 family protein [Roseimicrobium sp. ORNL1]QIF01208.1 hypothetical protein G5S37_06640 [Roseimicrobium sp. ORNL1]
MKPPTPSVLVALERRLEPLIEMERLIFRRKLLAAGFGVAAVVALLLWWRAGAAGLSRWDLVLFAVGAYLVVWFGSSWWSRARRVDQREIAQRLESAHPDMQAVLLTAMDQHGEGGRLTYLQQRVVADAVRHSTSHDWQRQLFGNKPRVWDLVSSGALTVFALLVALTFPRLAGKDNVQHAPLASKDKVEKQAEAPTINVEVRPGDTEVERNTRLVVDAKFTGGTPAHAVIVLSEDEEGKQERARVNMNATVENNAYGGVVKSVERDGFYRVEYEGGVSKVFRVTTYVHPELVRSDAIITPPSYSGQPAKEVKNTLNVSALEGSEIRFRMTVNKPVAVAELFGEDKTSIPLAPTKEDPLVLEGVMKPEESQKYRLHLVDAQERSNKQPPWIKVNILKDNPPKVDLVFPKRDLAVSPLQELPLEAKVWDDIGVEKAGVVFMLGDSTKEVPLSEGKLDGKKSHEVKTMLALEELEAKPRQMVSYYVWAEDHHPQGGVRRTMSDMFFAEVRHFEDIFREADAPPGAGQGQPSVADKLAQLQKQVVNATWRLVRDAGGGKKYEKMEGDVGTVKEGQDTAAQQTEEALGEVEDAEVRQALEDALDAMKRASGTLDEGIKKKETNSLTVALTPEREALEHLGRAQSREHHVMRAQNQQQGGQSQQNQNQIMQLELTQKEKMYEEASEAKEEETAEQQENLQVLNRLKELARRQEALAEKIKDLEEQMAKAKTEEEKAELQQQLKRLQEEQEQVLRDLDELQERMEKPENQQNMAQEREKLDKAREQAREAAEKLAQEETSAAANSATRAQENLEQVRDEFRQRTAKRFAEEMRQLKQQAAQLDEGQKQLAEALHPEDSPKQEQQPKPGEKGDTTAELKKNLERNQLRRQAEAQGEALDKILENMQQLSEQAEGSEPLLASSLHDAVRKAHSDGIKDALDETRLNLQYSPTDAESSERKAAQGIEELKKGVDRAAESVLGSETEALRMARNELDRLLNDVEKDQAERQQGGPGQEAKNEGQQTAQGKKGEGEQAQPGKNAQDAERRMAAADGDPSKEQNEKGQQASASGQQGKEGQQGKQPGKGTEPGKEGERGKEPGALAGNSSEKTQQQGQGQGQGQEKGQQQGAGQGEQQGQQQAGMQPGQGQGQGQQRGEGQGESQQAANGQQQGQGRQPGQQPGEQGQGQGEGQGGQQPGQGQRAGMMAGDTPGQGQGQQQQQGQQPGQGQRPGGQQGMAQGGQGQGQAQGQGEQGRQPGEGGQRQGGQLAQGGNRAGGAQRSGGGEGGPGGDGGWFFDGAAEADNDSPLTGSNAGEWSDRLRRVEESLDNPELKNQAAGVIENARQIRLDNRRNDTPPQSDVVQLKVVQPLAELRDRVSEELAKREAANPLAPLDRDPVPHRYREQVRRYYSELGGGK